MIYVGLTACGGKITQFTLIKPVHFLKKWRKLVKSLSFMRSNWEESILHCYIGDISQFGDQSRGGRKHKGARNGLGYGWVSGLPPAILLKKAGIGCPQEEKNQTINGLLCSIKEFFWIFEAPEHERNGCYRPIKLLICLLWANGIIQ